MVWVLQYIRMLIKYGLNLGKSFNKFQFWFKDLLDFYSQVPQSVPLLPGATSWRIEYQRLCDRTPEVLHQELQGHTDEVLHVSFSHNGRMFATTSKDRHIMVSII